MVPIECPERLILDTVEDLVDRLMYYDRKEDEGLPLGVIEETVKYRGRLPACIGEMPMTQRALFVVEDRPEYGRGHVVRSGALADELRGRGWDVEMLGAGSVGFRKASLVLIDMPRPNRAGTWGLKTLSQNLVIIDDEPGPAECALLVNGGAGATAAMYADSGAKTVLAGPDYALLRAEFQPLHLERALDLRHDHLRETRPHRGLRDIRLLRGLRPAGMARWLADARLVISYAGMTAMECACVGTPTVLCPRNAGENLNADGLKAAGAAMVACLVAPEDMADALLEHYHLDRMSAAGLRLVDGLGCQRVATVITEMFG